MPPLTFSDRCRNASAAWLTYWNALRARFSSWFFEIPIATKFWRVITPNQLGFFRIFSSIWIFWMLQQNFRPWVFILFIIAVITDLIDGDLARWKNEVTELGKILDPLADKMLISIPLLFIGFASFSAETTGMFLFSELMLMFTANMLKPYLRGKFKIPLASGSNIFGQIKMFTQSVAMGIIIWNPANTTLLGIGEVLVWVAVGFAILSFLRHLARMDGPVEKFKRIITIPNLITLSGIFLAVPTIIALHKQHFSTALILLFWIFVSDFLDGFIAKRFNQKTAFGAVIDPVRDFLTRMIVALWMFFSLEQDYIQSIIITIIIVEVFIGLVNARHARRWKSVGLVTTTGKIRAFVHYVVFGVLLLHTFSFATLSDGLIFTAMIVVLCSSLCALYSYSSAKHTA